ncbi:nucleotidyltransferase domain-containing protein [Nodosilinea sp. P-1105]|uniref:nucleotidyltransferase family protein n=1 Tax=Nodosilinea sp. P-1105 TaxID=2546229 RepID=UPI00146EC17F|nr:nucleotidyltransferase domain-containing protein [Nodosilinea sp. P-1105]NMF85623.1 nucleotidyltransferase domain-containing protein [Nodosilinea sp. P-1105]
MAVDPKYVAYWRQARAAQQRAQTQAKVQAWEEVHRIAAMLRDRYGATHIVVFGSLLKDRFQPESDLDIAADNIPKAQYFEAVAAANQYSQRWVDLKPLEDLAPYFRQRVFETGIALDA